MAYPRGIRGSFPPHRMNFPRSEQPNGTTRARFQNYVQPVHQNYFQHRPQTAPVHHLPNKSYENESSDFGFGREKLPEFSHQTGPVFSTMYRTPFMNSSPLNTAQNTSMFTPSPLPNSSAVENSNVYQNNCNPLVQTTHVLSAKDAHFMNIPQPQSNQTGYQSTLNHQYFSVPPPPIGAHPPNFLFNNTGTVSSQNVNMTLPISSNSGIEHLNQSFTHTGNFQLFSELCEEKSVCSSFQEKKDVSDYISKKEIAIDKFILEFSLLNNKVKGPEVSVPEFRKAMKNGLSLLKMLQQSKDVLLNLENASEEDWEREKINATNLQKEINKIGATFLVPENINHIKLKLKRISGRRLISKKRKKEAAKDKAIKTEQKEKLNQEIDKWLDSIKEKYQKDKRDKEMQKEADSILGEVRRKIQEAKKILEKLKVLEKLRAVRLSNALQKGLLSSDAHGPEFESRTSELRSLMQLQLSDYESEERALRVMLENEQEGRREAENLWRTRKQRALLQKRHAQVVRALFGCADEPTPDDPLYLFHQYQNSANTSLDNLVQIRHQWDMHLSDSGDPVPPQWVVPALASSSAWEDVLEV